METWKIFILLSPVYIALAIMAQEYKNRGGRGKS